MKLESPRAIWNSIATSWWDLLRAAWRLWPFAHIITYGFIPLQHRLLWVDAVELVWVTMLSVYAQRQREEGPAGTNPEEAKAMGYPEVVSCPLPGAGGQGGDYVEEILRGIESERKVVVESADGQISEYSIDELYSGEDLPAGEAADLEPVGGGSGAATEE